MHKIYFIILASILTLGCGQKTEKIQDSGPQFKFESDELNLQNEEVPIKRAEANQGPEIFLQVKDSENIVRVEKNLICSSLILNGRPFKVPDSRLFQFDISETEFNGLIHLPQNPTCELAATLYNRNGSSRTIKKLIRFLFDSPPNIPIKRMTLAGGSIRSNNLPNFIADQYQITNPYKYSIGFNYSSKNMIAKLRGAYDTNKGALFYSQQEFGLSIERVDVTSNAKDVIRFSPNEVSFKVQPGQTVTITAWGTVPTQFITYSESKKIVGVYVTDIKVASFTNGLMLWPDFNNPNEWRDQWLVNISETTIAPSTHMDPHFFSRILMQ